MENLYIVRKFVVAKSAKDAIKKEKDTPVHDVWVEDSFQKLFIENKFNKLKNEIKPIYADLQKEP